MSARRPGARHRVALARGAYSIPLSGHVRVRLPLSKAGRKLLAGLSGRKVRRAPRALRGLLELDDSGRATRLMLKRPVRLPAAKRHHY